MATHFSFLAWRIPWTEEPGGLSKGCRDFNIVNQQHLKIFFNLLCYSFCGSGIQEHLNWGPQTWGSLTGYHQGIRGAAVVSRLHKRRITHVMVSQPEILAGCQLEISVPCSMGLSGQFTTWQPSSSQSRMEATASLNLSLQMMSHHFGHFFFFHQN